MLSLRQNHTPAGYPPTHAQPRPLADNPLTPSALDYDTAITVAIDQVRWFRREKGFTPLMVFAALEVEWRRAPGASRPWPSWDETVWLVAEAWTVLPNWGDDVAVIVTGEPHLPATRRRQRAA